VEILKHGWDGDEKNRSSAADMKQVKNKMKKEQKA
jgi:hypothetical protein